MSTNANKRRRPVFSRTGLLFVTHDTYMRRVWQHTYNAAVFDGKTAQEATQIADDAKAAATALDAEGAKSDGTVQEA